MKKTLCLILVLTAVCFLASNVFASELSFADVKETDWFADAVSEGVFPRENPFRYFIKALDKPSRRCYNV